LASCIADRPDRLRLEGKPVSLPAALATPFGLVLYELATNAAKHGSLSGLGGRIELKWRIVAGNDQRVLELVWRERGGPPVTAPTNSGMGTALIKGAIPNAEVRHEFREDGLTCTIKVPLSDARANGETGRQ
jgi:two-component system, chemotaxis family, CheB/CheR fusion protein